jgi:hypothetical protein
MPIHQLDAQPLRLGIHHQCIFGGDAIEGVAACFLVEM